MCACVQDQLVVCTNILFITIHGITNWLFKQTLIRIHGKTPFYNCGCLHLMRSISKRLFSLYWFNPLNPELNPICYLLALLGAHHFLHVVCCECRVLSGRGLCDELITRPEESYRLRCVVVYDLETSKIGAPYIYIYVYIYIYDISNLRVKGLSLAVQINCILLGKTLDTVNTPIYFP